MKAVVAILTALTLAACSSVVSVQPVGKDIPDLDKLGLAGIWTDEDGDDIAFAIRDREKGVLACLSGDETKLLHLRQTGGMLFANLRQEGEQHHHWSRIKIEGPDLLRLQLPSAEHFATLVRQESVEGRVVETPDEIDEDGNIRRGTGFTVILDDPTGDWVAALAEGKLGDVFGEQAPAEERFEVVLKRVGGPLE